MIRWRVPHQMSLAVWWMRRQFLCGHPLYSIRSDTIRYASRLNAKNIRPFILLFILYRIRHQWSAFLLCLLILLRKKKMPPIALARARETVELLRSTPRGNSGRWRPLLPDVVRIFNWGAGAVSDLVRHVWLPHGRARDPSTPPTLLLLYISSYRPRLSCIIIFSLSRREGGRENKIRCGCLWWTQASSSSSNFGFFLLLLVRSIIC